MTIFLNRDLNRDILKNVLDFICPNIGVFVNKEQNKIADKTKLTMNNLANSDLYKEFYFENKDALWNHFIENKKNCAFLIELEYTINHKLHRYFSWYRYEILQYWKYMFEMILSEASHDDNKKSLPSHIIGNWLGDWLGDYDEDYILNYYNKDEYFPTDFEYFTSYCELYFNVFLYVKTNK